MSEFKKYLTTKLVSVRPCVYSEWRTISGLDKHPTNIDVKTKGFLVEYEPNGVEPKIKGFKGNVTWVSAEAFEKANYQLVTGLNFGMALELMKVGKAVKRVNARSHIVLSNGRFEFKHITAPYGLTTEDLLAEDWELAE